MKLIFSEAQPDYAHYIFPYAIWAFPEPGETPADLFRAGFLPSSRELDRFYLCRHLRVPLKAFQPTSENRRVLRKGAGLVLTLIPRAEFEFTPARRDFCLRYTRDRFGDGGLSEARLDSLFATAVTTHVLQVTDPATGSEIGLATLYVEGSTMAFYYHSFYDLAWMSRNLGMFMMTAAVSDFAARGCGHLYLGTCYSASALYKTQFAGVEFFDGFRWSSDLSELKFLLQRGQGEIRGHLLEDGAFRESFAASDLHQLAAASPFRGGGPGPVRPA